MKKYLFFLSLLLIFGISLPDAHAHCPLCTAAVGAAAIGAQYYGVDTSIIGIFIGGFAISTGLWVALKLVKKQYVRFQTAWIALLSFVLTVIPLVYSVASDAFYVPVFLFGEPGSLFNKVYWLNKLLLGSVVGSIATLLSFWIHTTLKSIRGKVLFPYQGVVLTLTVLALAAGGMYVLL
ncbi:hypothetical protein HZB00_02740 [Candidatus Woesearchaeota archaeon]|nr:hypothetical protein [Candidatus Woesearchaeota archaeon]